MANLRSLGGVLIPMNAVWVDRYQYKSFAETDKLTLAGVLDRYSAKKTDGRPITIESNGGWYTENQVKAIQALSETGGSVVLTWQETYNALTEDFNVIFAQTPFYFQRLTPISPFWTGTINLIERN